MTEVEVRPFEAEDARAYVALADLAFAAEPVGRRHRDTAPRVAHLHGSANPAGVAVTAWARLAGRLVGHAAAVPARFVARDGSAWIGWQLGSFVVDPSAQRRGIGGALVEGLVRALAGRDRAFVHTFPNPRSRPVFERHGFARVAVAPTRIAAPLWARPLGAEPTRVAGGFEARVVVADEAEELVAGAARDPAERGAFVRDGVGFAWRFLAPPVRDRYRFALLRHPDSGQHVIAIAAHEYLGARFAVLADAWPTMPPPALGAALRVASRVGFGRLVHWTSNVAFDAPPPCVRVPARLDPRPVERLALPAIALDPRELAEASIHTADWTAF